MVKLYGRSEISVINIGRRHHFYWNEISTDYNEKTRWVNEDSAFLIPITDPISL